MVAVCKLELRSNKWHSMTLDGVTGKDNMARTTTRPSTPKRFPTVLLTGFDAFGGDTLNPSWLAVSALNNTVIEGHLVVAAQLPTTFAGSKKLLVALLRKHKPALVMSVGVAGGRAALSFERIAINVQDARIADNAGQQPIDVPVVKSGPPGYFSTLPIKAMLTAVTNSAVDAEVSQTAGTFVCNHVFYLLMHALGKQPARARARGGFVHVPYLPGQGLPCMRLEDMVRGLQTALSCALVTPRDAAVGAGALN